MEVAFIEPYAHMRDYDTGIHMVLPEALDDFDYFEYYRSLDGYKILDNGAAEGKDPGHRSTWEYLIETAKSVRVNEIIVPDAMGNSTTTQRRAILFEKWLVQQDFDYRAYKWMGVVHGNSFPEIMACMYTLAGLEFITVLGLPRILSNNIGRDVRVNILSTPDIVNELIREGFPDGVHCLGGARWAKEAIMLADLPVRSIDTSYVASMSIAGKDISNGAYVPRPKKFWDQTYPDVNLADRNHEKYLEWCNA